MSNLHKQCPKCKFIIFDLEGGVFMGKPIDYWIDLQVKVEQEGTVDFISEIVSLKAKLYDAEEKLAQINNISK